MCEAAFSPIRSQPFRWSSQLLTGSCSVPAWAVPGIAEWDRPRGRAPPRCDRGLHTVPPDLPCPCPPGVLEQLEGWPAFTAIWVVGWAFSLPVAKLISNPLQIGFTFSQISSVDK